MIPFRIILLSIFYLLLSATPVLAEVNFDKALDAAKTVNQEIQKKINIAPVAQEINKALPTEEQAKGFLAGVWKIVMIVVRFFAKIFDWMLGIISSVFYFVLNKIGLDFFN
ncbi:MAG: hypothetical protein Q7S83_01160 [bacterium]|nr:hypothetical protein [bacterium]